MSAFLSGPVVRIAVPLVNAWPWLARRVNRIIIDAAVARVRRRPHPWSTAHGYSSWTALADRSWSARHLPPKPIAALPAAEGVMELFRIRESGQRLSTLSTCLFPAFAQYLTDGFIRTVMPREGEPQELRKRNTSNHQIDMCPLYGRTPSQTEALRLRSEAKGERGRLKSQVLNGEEYAPFLFGEDGAVKEEFGGLDMALGVTDARDKSRVFAFGGDRANAVPQVALINTLFLREHNRLAGAIEEVHPDWDDTRVFETARNATIVEFLQIVVSEYINHISPVNFRLSADPEVAWLAPWNKPNWIAIEFSLLYRWHSLMPQTITWGGRTMPLEATLFSNALLIERGLVGSMEDLSAQPAAELGLHNTADALLPREVSAVEQSRLCEVAPFVDYCAYVNSDVPRRFEDVSSDPQTVAMLKERYRRVEDLEFYVGLFAQDRIAGSPLPEVLLRFVAVDAFSQALTNPLLSEHVFKPETFAAPGWAAIHETQTLADVAARNDDRGHGFIGMSLPS